VQLEIQPQTFRKVVYVRRPTGERDSVLRAPFVTLALSDRLFHLATASGSERGSVIVHGPHEFSVARPGESPVGYRGDATAGSLQFPNLPRLNIVADGSTEGHRVFELYVGNDRGATLEEHAHPLWRIDIGNTSAADTLLLVALGIVSSLIYSGRRG
jgi:hypothetical protein